MPTTTTGLGAIGTVLSVTSLSTTYGDNLVAFETHGSENAILFISYTKGTAETSVSVKVEAYDSAEGWKVIPYVPTGTLVYTPTATATVAWNIVKLAKFETQLRVSAIANTATTDTALVVQVQLNSPTYGITGNIV